MRKAICDRCRQTRMVNVCTSGGERIGEYCAECFDHVPHDIPARNRTCASSGLNHNDHGFDNAVRALEGE